MLTGISTVALCLAAPNLAKADSLTLEAEGSWLQPFGDEVVFATFRTLPLVDTNETIDRGEDFTGRGQAIWTLNSWFSVSVGGGFAEFSNEDAAPHANLYTALPFSFIFPQIATVPNFVPVACGQICEQVYSDATANLDTDIEFYDFDVGADVGIGRNGKARFFAGVRYVRFDETLRGRFSNFNPNTFYRLQTLDTTRASSFEGWGPRVGFTADVPIGSNFSFGGTVAVAALFGDIETSINSTHTSTFAGVTTSNSFAQSISTSGPAYSVEVAPQISYTFNGENIAAKISAGYRFDHYLSIVDTQTRQTVAIIPPGGDITDDVKFDGPFLRVGVRLGSNSTGVEP